MPAEPLTLFEREEIRVGIARCESFADTARRLGRHRSTVSEEVRVNGGRAGYSAAAAQARAGEQRCRSRVPKLVEYPVLVAHVEQRLRAKDSPMTISRELAAGTYGLTRSVSHECVYQAVQAQGGRGLSKGLHVNLHRRRRCRKHRSPDGPEPKADPLGDFRPISDRPTEADGREQVGHLEGDLIIGSFGRSAIVTVFDRASRKMWLADLPEGHSAPEVAAALIELLGRIPAHLRHTLTWDQGREMADWADLETATGITVYFADAHSPWQRPTNENGSGLLRRYVGKGTDLSAYNLEDLRAIEHRINTMPRRTLDWNTANTVYDAAVAMTD